MYGKKCITKTKYEMMTNLLYGLVEQEVHCQTNRGPKIKILEKVQLPSLCTNLSFPMEPKEKVVIDCDGRKRLVHIYGVGEIKIW